MYESPYLRKFRASREIFGASLRYAETFKETGAVISAPVLPNGGKVERCQSAFLIGFRALNNSFIAPLKLNVERPNYFNLFEGMTNKPIRGIFSASAYIWKSCMG